MFIKPATGIAGAVFGCWGNHCARLSPRKRLPARNQPGLILLAGDDRRNAEQFSCTQTSRSFPEIDRRFFRTETLAPEPLQVAVNQNKYRPKISWLHCGTELVDPARLSIRFHAVELVRIAHSKHVAVWAQFQELIDVGDIAEQQFDQHWHCLLIPFAFDEEYESFSHAVTGWAGGASPMRGCTTVNSSPGRNSYSLMDSF